jgi:hypothetical protein
VFDGRSVVNEAGRSGAVIIEEEVRSACHARRGLLATRVDATTAA